jgi:hypothetical protein
MPPRLMPVALKITRTPLAGGGATVIEEAFGRPARRVRHCTANLTQSVGNQSADLELDNTGGPYDAWASGDVIRVEAKRPGDATYTLVVEGFAGEPQILVRHRPILRLPVIGLNAILDLVTIPTETSFSATAWTTIYDTLCTTYLPGYTRTITSDATTGTITFPAGMRLREALDLIRRSLVAATSQRWETLVVKDASTKEIRLYKRAATVQATLRAKDLLEGTTRSKGSAFNLVNKANVYGATVPSVTKQWGGGTFYGATRLDSTSKVAAIGFNADDTPLYAHTVHANRSGSKDPPSLSGVVARSSDNVDRVGYSVFRRRDGVTPTIIRNATLNSGALANLDDHDEATVAAWTLASTDVNREIIVWDLGSGKSAYAYYFYHKASAANANVTWKLWGSNDDSTYTQLASVAQSNTRSYTTCTGAPAGPYRYYKLTETSTVNVTASLQELYLVEFGQLATDPTNSPYIISDNTGAANHTVSTTGAATKELYRTDFVTARAVVKLVVKHTESLANASLTLRWQRSSNGSTWIDVALFASTISNVVDTIYLDGEGDFRYLRLIVQDDRAGGSAAITTTGDYVYAYFHSSTEIEPMAGDAMRGSSWTWTVNNLVEHNDSVFSFKNMEEQTWPAPRLALTVGRAYFFVYTPGSGASATSWWELGYGSDEGFGYHPAGLLSTDAGVTWGAGVSGLGGAFSHVVKYNNHQLTSESNDAASQTKYANFVPSGILYGSIQDASFLTQDIVDKIAAALIKVRADVTDSYSIPTKLLLEVTPGNRVTLHSDVAWLLGTSGDFDVLEHRMTLTGKASSTFTLNDRPARATDADLLVASVASRGTL